MLRKPLRKNAIAVLLVKLFFTRDEGVKTELKSEGERIKLKMKPFEIVTLKVGL